MGSAPPSLPPLLPPFAFVKEVGTVGEIQYAEQKSRAKERLDRQVLFHFLSLSLSLFIYSISLYDPLIKRGSLGSRKCRLATERRRIKIKSKAENVKKIGKKVHFFGLPLKKKGQKKRRSVIGFRGKSVSIDTAFHRVFHRVLSGFYVVFFNPKKSS